MNTDDIDYDLLDLFKNQFNKQLLSIKDLLSNLEENIDYEESVNALFRIFHNFKSSTSYLGLNPIKELVVAVEDVLETIRSNKTPINKEIIEWLYAINTQLHFWKTQMQEDTFIFSKAPEELLKSIRLTPSSTKLKDKLKTLNLLYIDSHAKRANQVVTALKKFSIDVEFRTRFPKEKKFQNINICIINTKESACDEVLAIAETIPNAAIVVILDKLTQNMKAKLMFAGINYFLTNPLKISDIKRELYNVTQSHFSDRRVLLENKKINTFIQNIQPLPHSIFKIQDICDSEESSIKDLIAVVKADPIITADILNASKSPIYGLKHVNTIDQAVSIFGKKTVKAITLSGISKNIKTNNLEAYQINEETFSKVASLRLKLMIKWYSKVSISSLSTLSISAILGNIGQLLLAQEIKNAQKIDSFIIMSKEDGFQIAEEKLFHTTTASITSNLLKYWKLDTDIVDSIRYSDNPNDAPLEIHDLTVANHIVFNTVLLDGSINRELSTDMYKLMQEEKLDTQTLIKAIEYISSI